MINKLCQSILKLTKMLQLLLIEGEIKLAKSIELELKHEGYSVIVCQEGIKGLSLARKIKPDLILLDWMLSDSSGLEICRSLRDKGDRVPIILLTTKDEINDRVASLDAGADDYIIKPFCMKELLVIIQANSPRNKEEDPDLLKFLDLTLNRRTREIRRNDRLIELTAKEYDLLEYLISNPRQVLTRDQILERVWGYDFMGDSNIIEVYVRYLRLKLEANNESRLIKTVRGVGYVLKENS